MMTMWMVVMGRTITSNITSLTFIVIVMLVMTIVVMVTFALIGDEDDDVDVKGELGTGGKCKVSRTIP